MPDPDLPIDTEASGIRWYAVVSVIGHLLLLGTGAFALSHITRHQPLGIVVAAVFALVYAGMWLLLIAPGSRRRLMPQERFLWKVVTVPVVVVVAALGEVWLLALVGASFVFLGDALDGRSRSLNNPREVEDCEGD